METVFIYTLNNPLTNEVKYIGFTNQSLKRRLQLHLSHSNKNRTYVQKWIKSLELPPLINLIEECDENIWQEREIYWIKYYREKGLKLCNLTDGGEGIPNLKRSEEFKLLISKRNIDNNIAPPIRTGILHSIETKQLMSNKAKGRVLTEEQKEKMSKAKLGLYKGSKSPLAKIVYSFNLDGTFNKQYNSISEACIELLTTSGNICRAIKTNKTCKNLKWYYEREPNNQNIC